MCYCISKDKSFNIGHCLYTCFIRNLTYGYFLVNTSNYRASCTSFNRRGLLCGKCKNGYGTAAYSFSLKCVSCHNETLWKNILLYVAAAYGPLTVFLVIIIVFTVSVNSAPLHGWIFMCQMITMSPHMRVITALIDMNKMHHSSAYKFAASVYGIWNLDFFRTVYFPFCLHPSLSTLQVMSLDYIIAAYPLAMIILVYALVELYSRDCRPVVLMWKPFHHLFACFRHQMNIRTSLVDAFGTFFSLSYVKMLSTTADILTVSAVYDGGDAKSYHMFYDGTMSLLGEKHIPLFVTALLVFSVCNIFPLVVIIFYSFPKILTLLDCFPVPLKNAIYPFMDNILGCYRDGTNGTTNCRYFALVYQVARILVFLILIFTMSISSYSLFGYLFIITGMLVAVIRPYKTSAYNVVDTILVLSLSLVFYGMSGSLIAFILDPMRLIEGKAMAVFPMTIPLFYITGYMVYATCAKKRARQRMTACFIRMCRRMNQVSSIASLSEYASLIH